jgi:serine/threonine protein phosphatase 1
MKDLFRTHAKDKPSQHRLYVIGDVHGHAYELEKLLRLINEDASKYPNASIEIVLVGDLVNRGPHSKKVLEQVAHLKSKETDKLKVVLLKSNHDIALMDFLDLKRHRSEFKDYMPDLDFLEYGGLSTLASYGIFFSHSSAAKGMSLERFLRGLKAADIDAARQELAAKIPPAFKDLLQQAKTHYFYKPHPNETGYFICHGGVMDVVPLDQQMEDVLTGTDYEDEFSRMFANYDEEILMDSDGQEWVVIHGHTIVGRNVHKNDAKISVDTGCYQGQFLTCAVIADGKFSGTLDCPSFYPAYNPEAIPKHSNWPPQRRAPSLANSLLKSLRL